jgi:hypothetical protein
VGLACCAVSALGMTASRYYSSSTELLAKANLDAQVDAAFVSALGARPAATRIRQQKLAMVSEGTPAVVGGVPGYFSVPGYFTPGREVGTPAVALPFWIQYHSVPTFSVFTIGRKSGSKA